MQQYNTIQDNTTQYNSIQYMLFLNMYSVVDEAAESIPIKHKHPSMLMRLQVNFQFVSTRTYIFKWWIIHCHISFGWVEANDMILHVPWKSKTKQRMFFRMIHVKDSLLPMGKVWSLDLRVNRQFVFTIQSCAHPFDFFAAACRGWQMANPSSMVRHVAGFQ